MVAHNDVRKPVAPMKRRESGSSEHCSLGGAGYAALVDELRDMLDRAVTSAPSDAESRELRMLVQRVSAELDKSRVSPERAWAGRRPDLPAGGHAARVPWVVEAQGVSTLLGSVTFRLAQGGSNGVVHGGAIASLFDEVMGRLVNAEGSAVARTAEITVRYSNPTFVGTPHMLEAERVSTVRRRILATARMKNEDGVVTAEASGVFVRLRPDQP